MVKSIVALLLALAVLAGPVAAQEPTDPSPDAASSEPVSPESAPSEPAAEPSGSDNKTASPPASEPAPASSGSSSSTSTGCPLVESRVGDPRVPFSQWVKVDPNGCINRIVYRVVSRLPP